jgi:hypothetical protein
LTVYWILPPAGVDISPALFQKAGTLYQVSYSKKSHWGEAFFLPRPVFGFGLLLLVVVVVVVVLLLLLVVVVVLLLLKATSATA